MVDMKANLFGERGEFDAVHEIVELLSPNNTYDNNYLVTLVIVVVVVVFVVV